MNQLQNNPFREDEISIIRGNVYPKVAGRLRLAHDQNENLTINTEVIRYDEAIAVVKATCNTTKGVFSGIGMASIERDKKIAPAILELAETRSIARALRFAGYGIEYCGAEEMSHTQGKNNGSPVHVNSKPTPQPQGLTHEQLAWLSHYCNKRGYTDSETKREFMKHYGFDPAKTSPEVFAKIQQRIEKETPSTEIPF